MEPDAKALSLAANAYAKALLQHEELFEFLAREVRELASREMMEVRNLAARWNRK